MAEQVSTPAPPVCPMEESHVEQIQETESAEAEKTPTAHEVYSRRIALLRMHLEIVKAAMVRLEIFAGCLENKMLSGIFQQLKNSIENLDKVLYDASFKRHDKND